MNGQQRLKQRSEIHLARKIWHFLGVLAMVIVFNTCDRPTSMRVLVIACFLFIGGDIVRNYVPPVNQLLTGLFRPLMRTHELNGFAGTTYLLIGTFIIVLLFPHSVVTLALLFLAVGDPIASYAGIVFGKDKLVGQKTVQGSVAAFFACALIACLYFYWQNLMTERLLLVTIISGLIGAVSELIPIFKLDDNLTFPVVSAFFIWLLFIVFGGI